MDKKLHSDLEILVDSAYKLYSEPTSILDRIRALTPLFAALVAGYVYCALKLNHENTATYGVLFWTPFLIGTLLLIISIFIMLYSLIFLSDLKQMPSPKNTFDHFYKTKEKMEKEGADAELILQNIAETYTLKKTEVAQYNFQQLKKRADLIDLACKLAFSCFALILTAIALNLTLNLIK